MKDANKMTPQELRALADSKEAKARKVEVPKPDKYGKLKQDVYWFYDELDASGYVAGSGWTLLTKSEIDDVLYANGPVIGKGEPFECYTDRGHEAWYGGCIDSDVVNADWAEVHLRIKRNK